jgi:holo-[acyl-carrier protein] synthase
MQSVGVDLVELWRIEGVLERWGKSFLDRIYTPGEQAFSKGRIPQLAARFAAKEAVMKALGTGIRGVGWREVEVTRKRGQPPFILLHGRAKARAERMGVNELSISLSHSKDYAIASVVMVYSEDIYSK